MSDTTTMECKICHIETDCIQGICEDCRIKKERIDEFGKIVLPVIEWLRENYNPHTSIEITSNTAELKSGEMCYRI